MRRISISLDDNPIGADPLIGLYNGINAEHAELELTQENSVVILVKAAATRQRPLQTVVIIQKDNDYDKTYEFYYDRYDVNEYIKNPYWTSEEEAIVRALDNSADLLVEIANKSGLNLTEKDVWINDTSIRYTGGTKTPNWLFKSIFNSIYFTGELVLWLHSGGADPDPDPDPDPEGSYEHIFEGKLSTYIQPDQEAPGYYESLTVEENGNRIYVIGQFPGGPDKPTLNWPTYSENDPVVLLPGHEWIIINSSGQDLVFDPAGKEQNKFYIPDWGVFTVKAGGTLRGTAIGWNETTNQWEWAISGQIVKGRTVGTDIINKLLAWYTLNTDGKDSHVDNRDFNNLVGDTVPGKIGNGKENIQAVGSPGGFGSYNSGTAFFGWFKVSDPDLPHSHVMSLAKFDQVDNGKFGFNYLGDQGWRAFFVNANNTETSVETGPSGKSDGDWQFVVAQVNNRFIEISINNSPFVGTEIPLPSTGSYTGLQLGNVFSNLPYEGAANQIGVASSVLTPEQVAWLYNGGVGRSYDTLE